MTDRASIFQGVQIGKESGAAPGTEVDADVLLPSLAIEPGISLESKKYRPTGGKLPTIVVPNKEWTEASLSGPLTYNELPYLLASVLNYAAPARNIAQLAAPATVPTTALAGTGAGALTNGAYTYKVTFVNAVGETTPSAATNPAVTVADATANGKIALSAIPLGAVGTTARKIYRTTAGGAAYLLVTTLNDNTTETYEDNIADAALGAAVLSSNTTAGSSYTWTFSPAQSAADTVATYTVEQGSAVRAHQFMYGLVTALTLAFARDECNLSGSMIGQRLADGISMTEAPTAVALIPLLPTEVSVYLSATQAGLAGASAQDRAIKTELAIGGRFGPIWPLKAANTSWAAHVETEPAVTAKLLVEADAAGMALLTNMRAGSTHWLRIKAEGTTIESTHKYSLTIDMAVKVEKPNKFEDSDGLYAISWDLALVHDATWGKGLSISLVNTLADL